MKDKFVKYLLASIIISPVAIVVGVISSGFGHGNYFFTKILFPYTMLSTRLTNEYITAPFVILALVQFLGYGVIIGLASLKRIEIYVFVIILVIHITAAYLCFYWPMPNFS